LSSAPVAGLSLRLEGVSVRHPGTPPEAPPALAEVDLRIGPGEHVVVVGPSGAGKTTLLHAAAAALRADHGRLLLDGQDPWRVAARKRRQLRGRLFLAPQIPPLPPRQRVVTAVLAGRLPAMSLAGSVRSLLYPADIRAAGAALAPFDLADRLFDRVDRLSGGERQRVSLARALLAPAHAWLLDEPLSALDPVRAAQALQVLREQAARRGVTLIVSMHQVEMALASFPRAIGLRDGTVRFDAAPARVSREQLQRLYARVGSEPQQSESSPEQAAAPAAVGMYWR
jgi:phosphonate transport system ATP-binding protein